MPGERVHPVPAKFQPPPWPHPSGTAKSPLLVLLELPVLMLLLLLLPCYCSTHLGPFLLGLESWIRGWPGWSPEWGRLPSLSAGEAKEAEALAMLDRQTRINEVNFAPAAGPKSLAGSARARARAHDASIRRLAGRRCIVAVPRLGWVYGRRRVGRHHIIIIIIRIVSIVGCCVLHEPSMRLPCTAPAAPVALLHQSQQQQLKQTATSSKPTTGRAEQRQDHLNNCIGLKIRNRATCGSQRSSLACPVQACPPMCLDPAFLWVAETGEAVAFDADCATAVAWMQLNQTLRSQPDCPRRFQIQTGLTGSWEVQNPTWYG